MESQYHGSYYRLDWLVGLVRKAVILMSLPSIGDIVGGLLSGLGNLFMQLLNWLWQQAVSLITWLMSLIPHLPIWPGPNTNTAISYVLQQCTYQLNTWNYYICVNLWIVLWMTSIVAESAASVFKALRWALSHLPWVGGD